MIVTKTLLAALATTAMTVAASAGTSPVSIVSGASHGNLDLTVSVQASSVAGYDYDFIVSNASGTPGASVTGIYFESGWASLISGGAFSGSGTLGSGSDSPVIAGWSGSTASYTVGTTTTLEKVVVGRSISYVPTSTDNVDDGIQEGNSGIVSFTSGATLADLESALGSAGFNVGVKVQDVVGDKYAAGWGLAQSMEVTQLTIVDNGPGQDGGDQNGGPVVAAHAPTPTAAAAGLALLGLAGLRRRRA